MITVRPSGHACRHSLLLKLQKDRLVETSLVVSVLIFLSGIHHLVTSSSVIMNHFRRQPSSQNSFSLHRFYILRIKSMLSSWFPSSVVHVCNKRSACSRCVFHVLQIQNLKDQLVKAHMLIEKADFLNTTQEEQEKILENTRGKIADRR